MTLHFPSRPPKHDPRLDWCARRLQEGADHQQAGRFADAMAIYQEVLRKWPECWAATFQLGTILYRYGMLENAELLFRKVVTAFARADLTDQHKPLLADTFYNLTLVLQESGRLGEAVTTYLAAAEMGGERSEVFVNLGTALLGLGMHEKAIEAFNAALECPTPAPEIRYNRGLANILLGRWTEGWEDFEYRWAAPSFKADYTRDLKKPRWDGEPTDQPVLIWSEQGFGDTLMLMRYIPLLKERLGQPGLRMEVQRSLLRFVRGATGVAAMVADGAELPEFEYHLPMFSLPHIFGTTTETVPPFVSSMPHTTIPGRIGLCWAGTTKHRNDRHRSISLQAFYPLFEIPGLTWQSLQLDRLGGMADTPLAPLEIPKDGDWFDTARVVASCDLVITVDTGVAHLAGVMGKPTWLLLSAWPDFRWMLERTDTPWYPTMTLYRQHRIGDWMRVIMQVRKDLEARYAV